MCVDVVSARCGAGADERLESLVARLEHACAALPPAPTLEDLGRFVETRHEPAALLAELDPGSLDARVRRSLAARVRRVLERDQALVLALFARRADVAAELKDIASARRATTGQRAPASVSSRRIA